MPISSAGSSVSPQISKTCMSPNVTIRLRSWTGPMLTIGDGNVTPVAWSGVAPSTVVSMTSWLPRFFSSASRSGTLPSVRSAPVSMMTCTSSRPMRPATSSSPPCSRRAGTVT